MPVSIIDALRAMDERKRALGVGVAGQNIRFGPAPDGLDARGLLVGMDIDAGELDQLACAVAESCAPVLHLVGAGPTLAGVWVDGALTGAMHALLRERETRSAGRLERLSEEETETLYEALLTAHLAPEHSDRRRALLRELWQLMDQRNQERNG